MLEPAQATRRRTSQMFAIALGLCAGCPDGSDVSVGIGDALNLEDCAGGSTDCKSNGTSTTATASEPKQCSHEVMGRLEPIFRIDLQKRHCPDASSLNEHCSVAEGPIAVGEDGSLWAVSSVSRSLRSGVAGGASASLWLSHYGADGVELGTQAIANLPGLNVQYQADVAALPNGDAAVVVYASVHGPDADVELDEHVWVQRYHADVTPYGATTNLSALGVADIMSTDDGKLLIGGDAPRNKQRGVLALLDESGLVWNQMNIPSVGTGKGWGVTGLSVDSYGRTTMLSVRDQNLAKGEQSFGVIKLDEQGNRVWNVTLSGKAAAGTWGWFAGDAAGNSTAIIQITSHVRGVLSGVVAGPEQFLLLSLDPSGAMRFSYTFGDVIAMSVARDSGQRFVTALEGYLEPRIYEVAPDGSSCRRFAFPENAVVLGGVQAARGDSLYVNAGRFRMVAAE